MSAARKLEAAVEALKDLFSDTSVSPAQTAAALCELRDEIDKHLETLPEPDEEFISSVPAGQRCRECPWAKKAAKGWLGAEMTPEQWTQAAHSEALVDCHMRARTQCAGIASYRANVGKKLRTASIKPGNKSDEVFGSPQEFITHHRSGGCVSSELKHED